ncbi:MAG: PIN domain-containing protein [Terriglobia bacterium]
MAKGSVSLLLDSVILIDHFNSIAEATTYLSKIRGQSAISVITRAEVLAGFDLEDAAIASRLLDRFPTFIIDLPIADLAARLRRAHRWKMPDALQAAVAQHYALRLVTRNTRDFPPDRHPFVLVPYTLSTTSR